MGQFGHPRQGATVLLQAPNKRKELLVAFLSPHLRVTTFPSDQLH